MGVDINFENLPPQEGYKINVDELEGYELHPEGEEYDLKEEGESLPGVSTRTFGANDFHISYIEAEEGSAIPWHTHTPIMYQVYIPLEGKTAVNFKDNNGETHRTEAGPNEHVYLPPGAHNKIEFLGPDRSRVLVIERETLITRVEHLVGDAEGLYDPKNDPEYALEIDTLRGVVQQIDDNSVEEY